MAKNTFQEQYPDYPVVPEKKFSLHKMQWPFLWIWMLAMMIGVPGLILYKLGTVPSMNYETVQYIQRTTEQRLARTAQTHAKAGNHTEAVNTFKTYFEIGGTNADMMALYAYSLSELGHRAEALTWARKAVDKAPQSKAAKLIHDALEPKN